MTLNDLEIGEQCLIIRRRLKYSISLCSKMYGKSEWWIANVERCKGTNYKHESAYLGWLKMLLETMRDE